MHCAVSVVFIDTPKAIEGVKTSFKPEIKPQTRVYYSSIQPSTMLSQTNVALKTIKSLYKKS